MKTDNFISFFIVCGFFTGLISGVFKFDDPFMIIGFTLFTTFVFYILIHIAIVNFIDEKKLGSKSFDKRSYEIVTNEIIKELEYREARMSKIIDSVDNELELIQNQTRKNLRKKNAKAA